MEEQAIYDVLSQRVTDGGFSCQVVVENIPSQLVRPYLDVTFSPAERDNSFLNDTSDPQGLMQVQIVVEKHTGRFAALAFGAAIRALFPVGLVLSGTGGTVKIHKETSVRAGFDQGSDWHVPVIVYYRASTG